MAIQGNIADVYQITIYFSKDYNKPDGGIVNNVYDAYISSEYLLADENYKKQPTDITVNMIDLKSGHPVVELITFGIESLKAILKSYQKHDHLYFNGSTLHTFGETKEERYDIHIGPRSGLDLMRFQGDSEKADAYDAGETVHIGEVMDYYVINGDDLN